MTADEVWAAFRDYRLKTKSDLPWASAIEQAFNDIIRPRLEAADNMADWLEAFQGWASGEAAEAASILAKAYRAAGKGE